VIKSRGTGCGDVVQRVPALLEAGRCHGQHPLRVQATARAVRPEAHLPSDHRVNERLLRRVGRRFDHGLAHDGPPVPRNRQEIVVGGRHLLGAADTVDQEILDLELQPGHLCQEGGPREHPVPQRVPPIEHQLSLVGQLPADHPSVQPGAEGAGRRPRRQRRDMHLSAPGTDAREDLDLVELGLDDLEKVQALVAPGGRLATRQLGPAVLALELENLPEVGNLLCVHQLGMVSLVAGLAAGIAIGLVPFLTREPGRVAEGRFR